MYKNVIDFCVLILYVDNCDSAFFWIYVFFHQLDSEGLWALYVSMLHKQ